MAVNEDVSALSTTAASNTPAGGDTVGPDLDNHLRDIKKNERRIAEHFITVSDENFKGRIKAETSGSTHTLNYFADSGDMPFVSIDDSASTVTSYVDGVLMGAAAKDFNKQTTTASAQTSLGLTVGTVGGQLLAETNTASARTRLDLGTAAIEDIGTSIGNVVELVTGSATSAAALPAIFGDKLLGLPGIVVQEDFTSDNTFATTSTAFPRDDTIPQNTEGDEALTIGFQPTNTSNKLLIEMGGDFGGAAAGNFLIALFQDSTANALRSAGGRIENNSDVYHIDLVHSMDAGTSSATFKMRYGPAVSGTVKRNGRNAGRLYGGTLITFIRVKEIKV